MIKLSKSDVLIELRDYFLITIGLICYAFGWSAFLLPYQITTGRGTGRSAIIY